VAKQCSPGQTSRCAAESHELQLLLGLANFAACSCYYENEHASSRNLAQVAACASTSKRRLQWMHFICAEHEAAGDRAPLRPPICQHWLRSGSCMYGSECFYLHPDYVLQQLDVQQCQCARPLVALCVRTAPTCLIPVDGLQRAQCCRSRLATCASSALTGVAWFGRAAAVAAALMPRRCRKPGSKYRNKTQNRERASALRHWLLSNVEPAALRGGSGIVDVGGGKGDFALQMCSLHCIATTILDPRQPAMLKCWRRVRVRGPSPVCRCWSKWAHEDADRGIFVTAAWHRLECCVQEGTFHRHPLFGRHISRSVGECATATQPPCHMRVALQHDLVQQVAAFARPCSACAARCKGKRDLLAQLLASPEAASRGNTPADAQAAAWSSQQQRCPQCVEACMQLASAVTAAHEVACRLQWTRRGLAERFDDQQAYQQQKGLSGAL
jgi:Zinc finger C-x8-C-x5-C-x3-H type (and similar)